jgi:hypothetical protein
VAPGQDGQDELQRALILLGQCCQGTNIVEAEEFTIGSLPNVVLRISKVAEEHVDRGPAARA